MMNKYEKIESAVSEASLNNDADYFSSNQIQPDSTTAAD
jgi:hypothetical protein